MAGLFEFVGRRGAAAQPPTVIEEAIEDVRPHVGEGKEFLNTLLTYLEEIRDGKRKHPLSGDEMLRKVCGQLCRHGRSPYSWTLDVTMEAAAALERALLPLGEETRQYTLVRGLFLYMLGPGQERMFTEFSPYFYAAFEDKQIYMDVIGAIQGGGMRREYHRKVQDFLLLTKVNFDSEEGLKACAIKAVGKLALAQTGEEADRLLRGLDEENLRRAGVHGIKESALQSIGDRLAAFESAEGRLKAAHAAARETARLLEQGAKTALSDLEAAAGHQLDLLKRNGENTVKEAELRTGRLLAELGARTAGAVEDLEKAYNQYLALQRDSLNAEKDAMVRDFAAVVREYEARIRAVSLTVSERTTAELARLRREAAAERDVTMRELKSFAEEEIDLTRRLEAIHQDDALLRKLEETVRGVAALDLEAIQARVAAAPPPPVVAIPAQGEAGAAVPALPMLSGAGVVIPREERMPVNYFLDKTVSYRERYKKCMERKAKEEEKGVLFHELFDDYIALLLEDWNPYVWGPSGCGKTHMIMQAARLIGARFFDIGRINEPYEILGTGTITGGYTRPPFFQGYAGGGIVFADEIDASYPQATIVFNNFTSNEYYIFPHYGRADRHPNFRFVAAGNTPGNGAESDYFREKIDASLQQRLTAMEFTYDAKVEKAIFGDGYGDWYEFALQFRRAADDWSRENGREAPGTFTTRDAARIRTSLDNGSMNLDRIMKYQFVENKELTYLSSLKARLEKIYRKETLASALLKESFCRQVEEMEQRHA